MIWPDMAAEFVAHVGPALVRRPEPCTRDVRVASKRTNHKRQVIATVTGGRKLADVRATVSLRITVLAETDEVAADLAALVGAIVQAWPNGRPVVGVVFVGVPFPATSDTAGKPEFTVVAELVVRGRGL